MIICMGMGVFLQHADETNKKKNGAGGWVDVAM